MATLTASTAPTHNHRPVLNWCNLLRTEEVMIYRQDRTVTIGRVDMVALDGSVFWIMEDHGNCRTMIHRNDGAEVYRLTGKA
ncbi:hypothetical protein [Arthrobacter globiformis]|uniref:hypothetical protein n=1 Tax=Arthrobacter globiformis TaxID=1665 RepID=UPI000B40BB2D|nr:hypothetical protein [Arthrobacter globiformis]